MRRRTEGLAHSIQARLKAKAEAERRPFAELLDLYGIERLLHRLGKSKHRDRFILKGALLVRHWLGADARPTRDVDLVGPPGLDADGVRAAVTDILETRVEDDGVEFDLASLRLEAIREASPLPGYRARFEGFLGQAVIHFQVDVVSGESVFPPGTKVQMPGLLGLPVAEIRGYTPYSVVAEKLEAIVALGDSNSRMKDYYDLTSIAAGISFDGETLAEAMRVCFAQRSTAIPDGVPVGLDPGFAADNAHARLWRAFRRKSMLPESSSEFTDVVAGILSFVLPPLHAARLREGFGQEWRPGGPWRQKGGR